MVCSALSKSPRIFLDKPCNASNLVSEQTLIQFFSKTLYRNPITTKFDNPNHCIEVKPRCHTLNCKTTLDHDSHHLSSDPNQSTRSLFVPNKKKISKLPTPSLTKPSYQRHSQNNPNPSNTSIESKKKKNYLNHCCQVPCLIRESPPPKRSPRLD